MTLPVSGTVTVAQVTNPVAISGTTAVSGTVTATPSGTYNVEITGSAAMLNGYLKAGGPDSGIVSGTFIDRWGSISASSTTRTEILSGTATASANYPAQNVVYTVPAGKTLYLHQLIAEFDSAVSLTRTVTFDLSSGAAASTIFAMINVARDSAGGIISNEYTFAKPKPIPAGTAIRIFVRASGVNSLVSLRWVGVEV